MNHSLGIISTTLLGWVWHYVLLYAQPSYGILLHEYAPVRKYPTDTTEQVTQLLFGDAFRVLEYTSEKNWVRISNVYDGYEGWLATKWLSNISEAYYQRYAHTNHPVCLQRDAHIQIGKRKVRVPPSASLPFLEDGKIDIDGKKYPFEGKSTAFAPNNRPEHRLMMAALLLDTPYLWGGRSPAGIDCSGFSQAVFKMSGYRLRRDSYQQAEQGREVAWADRQAGDLVFFQRKPQHEGAGRVVHVGILVAPDQIIHADGKVRLNRLDTIGIWREDWGKYSHYLKSLRRME